MNGEWNSVGPVYDSSGHVEQDQIEKIIVLIPVSRYKVTYEVAEGLPYSHLERLTLAAVGQGISTVEVLSDVFQLHPRLIIQALITLTQSGWLALGSSIDAQFALTAEGKEALRQEQLPESTNIVRRHTYIIAEHVTGSVVPEHETQYVTNTELRRAGFWEFCYKMPMDIVYERIDESQVQQLLPRPKGQRLHWIGPIELWSKRRHYIPVQVDLTNGEVYNIPQRCERALRNLVLDWAREISARAQATRALTWEALTGKVRVGRTRPALGIDELPATAWPITWTQSDLIQSATQHDDQLRAALASARTNIVIATASIKAEVFNQFSADIAAAVSRGVYIDLLIGHATDLEAITVIEKLAQQFPDSEETGQLHFNREPAYSNSKILLWDDDSNLTHGIVGTYDWFSDRSDIEQLDLSLHVTNHGILATLAWWIASVWSNVPSEALSSVPDRWRKVATNLEAQSEFLTANTAGNEARPATVHLVQDQEHLILIQDWSASAQMRLILALDMLGNDAAKQLGFMRDRSIDDDFFFQVQYGDFASDIVSHQEVQHEITKRGGSLARYEGLHFNAIVADNLTCLGSYRFLQRSPRVTPSGSRMRDLGVVVDSMEFADRVVRLMMP
jgi:hypothetical protein